LNTNTASRKRPCRVCGKWFRPNPRVGSRQKTCGCPACKKEWHRRKSSEWNKKNSDHFKANYLRKKLTELIPDESKSPAKPSPNLNPKRCLPLNGRLKSGINPMDFEGILSVEQAIVIEYIIGQIVNVAPIVKNASG